MSVFVLEETVKGLVNKLESLAPTTEQLDTSLETTTSTTMENAMQSLRADLCKERQRNIEMERRLENLEALLPDPAKSGKKQDDNLSQNGGLSSRDPEALFRRLWQESRARDDNSWDHFHTELAGLRRRISVVEDLQEETEVTPEKFVTEETFDTWRDRHMQIVQNMVDNERTGRAELEQRLEQMDQKALTEDTLNTETDRVARDVNVLCTSMSTNFRELTQRLNKIERP